MPNNFSNYTKRPVMENKFASLGDIDNRFSAAVDSKEDVTFNKSVYDNIRSKVMMDAVSDTLMTGLNGGPNVTRVQDNVTGDQYALIAYTDLIKNYEAEGLALKDAVITRYTAAEIKNGIAVGNEQDVYRKMGIAGGLGFPESQQQVGIYNTQDLTKPENLRHLVSKAQEAHRVNLKERVTPLDYRGVQREHHKMSEGLRGFVEEKTSEVQRLNENLDKIEGIYAGRTLNFDQKTILNNQRNRLKGEIESNKIDGTRAIISPGLFELDENGKAFLSDSADLSNKFAQINDASMISLNDVEKRYSIGKVSEQSINNSPNVLTGDTVINAIRVRAADDQSDTNIYAINDGKETWIRAERIEGGAVSMVNGDALKALGINGDKLLMGGEHPESRVSSQISPRALREQISEHQIKLNHKIMTNTLTDESVNKVQASSLANDTEEAIKAKIIDNRWSIEPLTRAQISDLEALEVIPSVNAPSTNSFNYVSTYSAIVVTDNNHDNSSGPRPRIIGQSIINSDYNNGAGRKKLAVADYEVFVPSVKDSVSRGMDWVRGDVYIDTNAVLIAASLDDSGLGADPVQLDGKAIFSSYEITPETVAQTLLDSDVAASKPDAKMTSKYGLGGLDETLIAHQEKVKEETLDSGFDWGNEVAIEASAPRRRNGM